MFAMNHEAFTLTNFYFFSKLLKVVLDGSVRESSRLQACVRYLQHVQIFSIACGMVSLIHNLKVSVAIYHISRKITIIL
jgi:hypothetical protein